MSLTSADTMIDYLRTRLHQYAEMVSQQCALGLTDEAKKAETFYKHLFNCLGFQFENLNDTLNNPLEDLPNERTAGSINYPAIDLGDATNRTAIQVSFQRDNQADKLKRTYVKFIKQEFQNQYDRLTLLFPTATNFSAPLFDELEYPGVKLFVITHEDILQLLLSQYSQHIERTYEFVRYWLDQQYPQGATVVWRDEFQRVLRYDAELKKIPYPYSNVRRESAQRYLEASYCESLREFIRCRRSISYQVGGHIELFPFLPEFRELEQRIDSLVADLSGKFYGSLYAPMPSWVRLEIPNQHFLGFMPEAFRLDVEQTKHCELISRQISLLLQLIWNHRQLIQNSRPVPNQFI
jgi:hypothetical protein